MHYQKNAFIISSQKFIIKTLRFNSYINIFGNLSIKRGENATNKNRDYTI